jgi:hypothetical protein
MLLFCLSSIEIAVASELRRDRLYPSRLLHDRCHPVALLKSAELRLKAATQSKDASEGRHQVTKVRGPSGRGGTRQPIAAIAATRD